MKLIHVDVLSADDIKEVLDAAYKDSAAIHCALITIDSALSHVSINLHRDSFSKEETLERSESQLINNLQLMRSGLTPDQKKELNSTIKNILSFSIAKLTKN